MSPRCRCSLRTLAFRNTWRPLGREPLSKPGGGEEESKENVQFGEGETPMLQKPKSVLRYPQLLIKRCMYNLQRSYTSPCPVPNKPGNPHCISTRGQFTDTVSLPPPETPPDITLDSYWSSRVHPAPRCSVGSEGAGLSDLPGSPRPREDQTDQRESRPHCPAARSQPLESL